jgi:micrococcal nuclease
MSFPKPYTYRASFTSNYDGDTVRVVLDLGMDLEMRAVCRLFGIDTPEMRDKNPAVRDLAYAARDRVAELLEGKEFVVESVEKPDKYGRLLCIFWVEGMEKSVNDLLVEEGLAKKYDGGTKEAWG